MLEGECLGTTDADPESPLNAHVTAQARALTSTDDAGHVPQDLGALGDLAHRHRSLSPTRRLLSYLGHGGSFHRAGASMDAGGDRSARLGGSAGSVGGSVDEGADGSAPRPVQRKKSLRRSSVSPEAVEVT